MREQRVLDASPCIQSKLRGKHHLEDKDKGKNTEVPRHKGLEPPLNTSAALCDTLVLPTRRKRIRKTTKCTDRWTQRTKVCCSSPAAAKLSGQWVNVFKREGVAMWRAVEARVLISTRKLAHLMPFFMNPLLETVWGHEKQLPLAKNIFARVCLASNALSAILSTKWNGLTLNYRINSLLICQHRSKYLFFSLVQALSPIYGVNFILKNKILKGTTLTKGYPLSKRGSISFEYPASSLQIHSQSAGPLPIHNWSKTCGG